MKQILQKLFQLLGQSKVYFGNAAFYLSIINFIMILATFKLTYNINISAFILAPIGVILILILGFIDYKLVMLHQTKYANKQNDIKMQLNRIEKKLDKIENKN